MVRLYTFSILLLLSISFCVGEESEKIDEKIVIDLNEFIDRANPLIVTAILENNLDPLQIPNITKSIALSTVNITNGYLHDLSKIHRNKPATLVYQNKQLTFNTGLEIKNVTMYADYALKRIWTQRYGKVVAYATPLQVEIGLHCDLKTFNFTLTSFDVNKIKQIKVKLSGNNNSDWIVNAITNAATGMLGNYIRKTVSSEASNVIQGFLNKLGRHQSDHDILLPIM